MAIETSTTCSDASTTLRSALLGNGVDCAWLDGEVQRLKNLAPSQFGSALSTAYTVAGRKFSASALVLPHPSQAQLEAYGLLQLDWTPKQAARACLLLSYAALAPASDVESKVRDLFYKGDSDERIVVLRCLPLLPTAAEHGLLATDAVRSHVQGVFEAIACENPYPLRYFDDLAFNQLVMKAYFTGVAAHRIAGLQERRNSELSRMALDFAAERRAASRPVPADLDLVTG